MSGPGDLFDPVDRIAGEFLERHRRGEMPEIEEYAARHPELAGKIREVFAALLLLEDFGSIEEETHDHWRSEQEDRTSELRELGDYRIVRRIGRGGMGVVYEAEQVSLRRRVALKVLPFHSLLSPDHLRRFQREARAAARLHHPNIVPVHEVGQASGVHYYAMQLIQGQGLDEVLEEIRRLRGIASEPAARAREEIRKNASRRLALALLSASSRLEEPPPAAPAGVEDGGAKERAGASLADSSASSSSARLPGQTPGSASSESHADYCRSIAMIGLQVAEALAHAHESGVLHRDIKPSNLLLDLQGTMWVTDFGLAKTEEAEELTHSGDLVGTLRYMGPERFQGWSDPSSDIYGLGVTLYELLTLRPAFTARDRATLVREILHLEPPAPRRIDRRIPRDLETVILKAIEKEPAKRYPSAARMAGDLRRFLENRPIVGRRASPRERVTLWFRRNPLAAALIVMVGVLVLAAAVTASGVAMHLARLARDLGREQEATRAHLRRALLEEARSRRSSRRSGQRHRSLEALVRAAAIEPGLDVRREAAAALALIDLVPEVPEWEFSSFGRSPFTFDAHLDRYAYSDEDGVIRVCRVADRTQLLELAGGKGDGWNLGFSPPGRHLVAAHGDELSLWDLESGACVVRRSGFHLARFDFSADGRLLAATGNGKIAILDVATGRLERTLPCGEHPRGVSFHPQGRLLAASGWQPRIDIWDIEKGVIEDSVELEDVPFAVAWHPSGKLLAAGGSSRFRIYVWATGSYERPRRVLDGHRGSVTHMEFSPGGDLLASYGYDNRTLIWDGWLGEKLLEYEGVLVGFSADGRRLGFRFVNAAEVFAIARPTIYRRIHGRERALHLECALEFSPDGRWLVSARGDDVVRLWDVESGDELASLPLPAVAAFFIDARQLLTSGKRGLHLWPLDLSADGTALRIGPPRAVVSWKNLGYAALWQDGRTLLVVHFEPGWHAHTLDLLEPKRHRTYESHPGPSSLDMSPDGRWLAGGSWHGRQVAIWRAGEPKPVVQLPVPDSANVRFTPDGRWLILSDGIAYRFLSVGSWKEERRLSRYRVHDPPGWVPFSPDGRVAALPYTLDVIRLIDLETGEELVSLEPPQPMTLTPGAFSPDGSLLAASSMVDSIHVWDLRELRSELGTRGLDWGLPPDPPPPPRDPSRPRPAVTVLPGELAPEEQAPAAAPTVFERAVGVLKDVAEGVVQEGEAKR